MNSFSIYLLSSIVSCAIAQDGIFVDDLGTEHKQVDNPKVIMSAQLAISMHHLGKKLTGIFFFDKREIF